MTAALLRPGSDKEISREKVIVQLIFERAKG